MIKTDTTTEMVATETAAEAANKFAFGAAFLELVAGQDVPVLSSPQVQGDVSILPHSTVHASTPIPMDGVVLLVGAEGHSHTLMGMGNYEPGEVKGFPVSIGRLSVPEGATAWLGHPQHGLMGIGAGSYVVGRQREFAGEWRLMAD